MRQSLVYGRFHFRLAVGSGSEELRPLPTPSPMGMKLICGSEIWKTSLFDTPSPPDVPLIIARKKGWGERGGELLSNSCGV